jgi:hypothetical protein
MAEKLEPQTYRDLRVPEVRLVRLADKLTAIETVETVLDEVHNDLISVEVTRHASGPGEYKLTLANWDPIALRDKYTDLTTLTFGTRLRIEMRYLPDSDVDIRRADKTSAWVPMIAGPITEIQFSFGSEGSRVSITGEDDLRALKDHNDKRIAYKDNEHDIIAKTLRDAAHYPLDLELPVELPARLKFLTDQSAQNRINESLEKGQSFLEFIQKFVDQYDLELYLSFGAVPPKTDDSDTPVLKQTLNLVPARASTGPTGLMFVLRHGYELLEFSPTLKVADQFTSVRVRGRHRHRDVPKGVDGVAEGSIVADELKNYVETNKKTQISDKPLVSAPEARERCFGKNESDSKEKTNLDEYRAEAAARAQLLRKARELVVIQASTVGLPRLQPGGYVRFEDVSDAFNGIYYVSSTTHSVGSDGMKTRLTAQRAGMHLPEKAAASTPKPKTGAAA